MTPVQAAGVWPWLVPAMRCSSLVYVLTVGRGSFRLHSCAFPRECLVHGGYGVTRRE